ncbi:hypothetical protein BVRB_003180 [Beta vulgaris subsp. vulgaris]|uniref:Uncharacterized protein n=1 Tax=Beta vulgaris subsp. vulgaris TaxID=3555 RepID=A0A0J8DYJ7_BETVV|nr:hypothetical protein BVRB_003180 [Beta vulgaris subsp. vulgaris]
MNAKVGVVSLAMMLAFVMLATKPQTIYGVRPLSDIMLQKFNVETHPLACSVYEDPCSAWYPCCGKCYCDFKDAFHLWCTLPAFDYSGSCY